ncbi:methyltransferase domain-containing protein [Actinomadura sp. DSM 109109]|nr:methyltransferase domain-containing protein [Actinomadura lepetitiana]
MTAANIDPLAVKEGQRANWDALSPGWEGARERFELGAAAVTERLLDLGGVREGHAVLDVGTGHGEPALSAARRVGPAGRVTGVDISPSMLAVARRRAAGLPNVAFAEADVESIGLPAASFDVVLSRWGLMFAVDRVAALRGLARLLVPGGVLAAAVWSGPPRAPAISLGFRVLSERLGLPPPPPGTPGPFSMSDPERVAAELAAAGFTGVSVTELVVRFPFDSVEQCVGFTKAVTPPALLGKVAERFGSADDPGTWRAFADATRPYRSGDGGPFTLPSTALVVRAAVPG